VQAVDTKKTKAAALAAAKRSIISAQSKRPNALTDLSAAAVQKI
jgi:hypothetical protein